MNFSFDLIDQDTVPIALYTLPNLSSSGGCFGYCFLSLNSRLLTSFLTQTGFRRSGVFVAPTGGQPCFGRSSNLCVSVCVCVCVCLCVCARCFLCSLASTVGKSHWVLLWLFSKCRWFSFVEVSIRSTFPSSNVVCPAYQSCQTFSWTFL